MRRRGLTVAVFLALVIVFLAACAKPSAAPAPTPVPREKVEVMIFSAPAPGTSYNISFGIYSIVNKYHPWIRMKFQETQGVGESAKWADSLPAGQRERSIIMPSDASYWQILDGAAGYPQLQDLRLVMPLNFGATVLVTFNPAIKTLTDLAGKTVAHAPKTWGGWAGHEAAFKSTGVMDKITFKHVGLGPAASALRDGLVDAAVTFISSVGDRWLPSPTIEELRATKKLYYIDFPDHRAQWLKMSGRPYSWVQIPAGAAYNDTPFGAPTMNTVQAATFAKNDPEIVYEIIKTVFDHWAEYESYEASLKGRSLQWMASAFHVSSLDEIHPGALKYFQEKGLKIPVAGK